MSFIMGALAWQARQNALMTSITTIFAFMSLIFNCFIASRPRYACVCTESGGGRVNFTYASFSPKSAQKAPLDCKKMDVQATIRKTLIHPGLFISSLHQVLALFCERHLIGLCANPCLTVYEHEYGSF